MNTGTISNTQLYEMFKQYRENFFVSRPDMKKVVEDVMEKMELNKSCLEAVTQDIEKAFKEYKAYNKNQQKLVSSSRKLDEKVILKRSNYSRFGPKVPLDETCPRTQRRRLSDYKAMTSEEAKEQMVSPTKLYSHGLKSKHLTDRKVASVGRKLFSNGSSNLDQLLSFETALAIFIAGKMTKRTYIDIRLLLKGAGHDIFPTYAALDDYRELHRPAIKELCDPLVGVKADYKDALKKGTEQLFRSLSLPQFSNLNVVHLKVHDGLDGSGGHSIFNQKGNVETNNIIMYMFRFEKLETEDGQQLWRNKLHASASACHPVMLLMGKESYENCRIVSTLQEERQNCSFTISYLGRSITVYIHAEMSMIDGKLHSLLSGLNGAFCCLCSYDENQCNDLDYIKSGFPIDRSLEGTMEICDQDLHLVINRKKGDYKIRKGVTQIPITKENHNTIHPLHCILRCFGWIYKICYHAVAGHLTWSEAKVSVSNRTGRALEFLNQAKEEIQADIKKDIGVLVEKPDPTGHGGSSTTGNVAKTLLNNGNRFSLTKGINNSELREKNDKIILNVAVILGLINSNRKIDVVKYKEFCRETMLLVKSVSWIKFTPTAHSVLAHSPELVEQNHGFGLLNYTESGLEANNKYLRQYRLNYSRKTSQHDNLKDCFYRLWDKSDSIVVKTLQRLHCTCCQEEGHTVKSCPTFKKNIAGCPTQWQALFDLLCITV